MKPLYFLSVFIIGFLFSCKKSGPEVISYKFSPKAFAFVKLNSGKYFVYKNSATQLADSFVVANSETFPVYVDYPNFGPPYNAQKYIFALVQYAGSTVLSILHITAVAGFVGDPYKSTDTAAVDLREQDNSTFLFIPHTMQPLVTKTVEGIVYNNVAITTSDNGLEINHPAYKKTITWWAGSIGPIKRELFTTGGVSMTYTLLRHN